MHHDSSLSNPVTSLYRRHSISPLRPPRETWNSHKIEIYQVYIEENKTLHQTIEILEPKLGLKARERTWKTKLKEWGFFKNLSTEQKMVIGSIAKHRKVVEGKETVFFHNGTQITTERIETFKRMNDARGRELASAITNIPEGVTYHTPLVEHFNSSAGGHEDESLSVAGDQPSDVAPLGDDGFSLLRHALHSMSEVSSTISPTSHVSLGTWDEHGSLILNTLGFDELLNNFCTETYHTIHRDPVQQSVWKDNVPQIARSFDFVMHSLLALSALHWSYLDPQEESYALRALLHHQLSIHLAGKVLPRITNENCSALYIFSVLLALYVIARPRKQEDLLLVGEMGIAPWLMMFRGTRAITDNSWESLISGPLAPMIKGGMQRVELRNSANNSLSIGEEQLMVLQGLIIKTTADAKLLRIYTEAVEELRKSFMAFGFDQYNHGTTDAFIWVHRLSDEYLLLLRGQTQESLCILAFFSVLLHKMKAKWWCEGWSTHLMTQINRLLDEAHRRWIWWPFKEVFE